MAAIVKENYLYKLNITYNLTKVAKMAVIKARLRQWGGSLGLIIPVEEAKKEGLMEGQEVVLELKKQNPIKIAFGSLAGWKIDAQKAKDELRKGWSR